MATITAAAGGGAWQTGASWVGGVRPTAADDVLLTGTSGNITIDSGAVCRSLNCTGYTGTLTHTAGVTLTIGDATAGLTSVALLLVAGMTYTLGNAATSALSFISTSATQQTIATGGKTLGNWTVNGVGSSYLLSDANSIGATATVTATAGTLATGGQTCSWGLFVRSGSAAFTFTPGASAIAITGTGTAWSFATVTNLTVTANTAVVTMSGASVTFSSGAVDWNGMTLVQSGSGTSTVSGGAFTVATFTRNGTAVKTDALTCSTAFTVTGTATLAGNSVTNRLLVQSNTLGTARTITAAVVSLTNLDFMDITGAGAASPFTGTSLGDCLGNSGITFTTAAAQTWQGTASGSWSDVTKWTSRVPLPQDDVVIASAFVAGRTVTADMPRLGKSIDWTGSTGTPTFTQSTPNTVYGSVTLIAGMTFTPNATWTFAGRGASVLVSAGKSWTALVIAVPGGSLTLGDALTSISSITLNYGGFDTASFSVMSTFHDNQTGATKSLTLGTSTWTLTSTGTFWNINPTGTTMSAASSTIVVSGAASASRTFAGGGKTYGTITYTVANSPGALVFTGANTITNLNIGSGRQVTFPSSTTTTVTNWNVAGVVNGYVYLPGVTGNYASAPDSAALSVTGDLDIRVRVALDDWTPAAGQTFVSKYAAAPQRSFKFDMANSSGGVLRFVASADGTNNVAVASSTVAPVIADGTTLWIRVTRASASGDIKFYTASGALSAPVAADFTQLGTTVSQTAGVLADTTAPLTVGIDADLANFPVAGKLYRAQVRNGIDGTVVFDADFTAKAFGANTFTESSSQAATVTINGAAAQAGDGRVEITSSTGGTAATLSKSSGAVASDYLRIKDSTATGGASWYAGVNSVNVSGNTGWIFTGLSASGSLATTTATGNAGVPSITINGALATTTSTANAGSVVLSASGSLATTTATGNAGSTSVTVAGSLATSPETAMAGSPTVSVAGSLATSTETALAGGFSLSTDGSLATSIETANAGTAAVLLVIAGSQAVETETAWAGETLLAAEGALATETSTALDGSFYFGILGGQATSIETANAGTAGTGLGVPGSTRATSSVASTRASSSSPRTTASAS